MKYKFLEKSPSGIDGNKTVVRESQLTETKNRTYTVPKAETRESVINLNWQRDIL